MSKKALTDEELFAQFEDIPSSTPDAAAPKTNTAAHSSAKTAAIADAPEDDPLAELSALAKAKPVSRPNTPRLSSSATSGTTGPKVATPPSSGRVTSRNSEDKPTRDTSGEQSTAETIKPADSQTSGAQGSGGGWWGSVFTVASAAVNQAQAAVKDIRSNEEALKWANQVRGNVDTLRAYGMHNCKH